jgi:hypothetical protein
MTKKENGRRVRPPDGTKGIRFSQLSKLSQLSELTPHNSSQTASNQAGTFYLVSIRARK